METQTLMRAERGPKTGMIDAPHRVSEVSDGGLPDVRQRSVCHEYAVGPALDYDHACMCLWSDRYVNTVGHACVCGQICA